MVDQYEFLECLECGSLCAFSRCTCCGQAQMKPTTRCPYEIPDFILQCPSCRWVGVTDDFDCCGADHYSVFCNHCHHEFDVRNKTLDLMPGIYGDGWTANPLCPENEMKIAKSRKGKRPTGRTLFELEGT